MPANDFETTKRREKCAKLISAIDDLIRRCGLDPQSDWWVVVNVFNGWDQPKWNELALTAGVRPPSAKSQQLVIETLQGRARRSA